MRKFKKRCLALLDMAYEQGWMGACYSMSACMVALAKDLGIDAHAKLGILTNRWRGVCFDHAWVEVDGEVCDMAIELPLMPEFAAPYVWLNDGLIYDYKPFSDESRLTQMGEVAKKVYESGTIQDYMDRCPSLNLFAVCAEITGKTTEEIRDSVKDDKFELAAQTHTSEEWQADEMI